MVKVNDDVMETCDFLSEEDEFGYLCDWAGVALACPRTCGICADLENVECTANNAGNVLLDETVGEKSCGFLESDQDRLGFACSRTSVALHCPVTCQLATCQEP